MNALPVARGIVKFLGLILVILCGLSFYPLFFFGRKKLDGKIAWMQWMSRRFLWLMNCRVTVLTPIPERGLIVSNHLSYVDIVVIGSICPTLFVAKSDVEKWPVFGALAQMSGTLFVNRNSRVAVGRQIEWISIPLQAGYPVVLFPEGTSSDGTGVLPFRSSLLEAAFESQSLMTPAAISYQFESKGDVGLEIAYWGDMTLLPHLFNLFTKPSFKAILSFGTSRVPLGNRKEEARLLHAETLHLLNLQSKN